MTAIERSQTRHILSGAVVMAQGLCSSGGHMQDAEEGDLVALMVEGKASSAAPTLHTARALPHTAPKPLGLGDSTLPKPRATGQRGWGRRLAAFDQLDSREPDR